MKIPSNVIKATVIPTTEGFFKGYFAVRYERTSVRHDKVIKDVINGFPTRTEAITFRDDILAFGIDIGE